MKKILILLIIAGVVFSHGGGICRANSFSIQMVAYVPEIPGITAAFVEDEQIIQLNAQETEQTEQLPIQQETIQSVVDTTGQYQMFILRTYYVK